VSTPICVAVVVWNDKGHIATSARRHDHNSWGLPGGKVEPQDGDADDLKNELELVLRRAAIRELHEETGLIVDLDDLDLVYAGICKDESGGGNPDSITFTYETTTYTGEIKTADGEPPAAWNDFDVLIGKGSFRTYNQFVLDAAMSL
jgi:8-oxo-dGTP pyrophosphatase MutT (NUDIX family)